MNANRWNCSVAGLGYFLATPRIWGWAFLGLVLNAIAMVYLCYRVLSWTAPSSPPYFWPWVFALGWTLLALVLFVAIVMPFLINVCFLKAFQAIVKRPGVNWISEIASSFWIFFRTLKWRILWPVLIVLSLVFAPLLTFPVSLFAINHLALLEGLDLALTVFGYSGSERVQWLKTRGGDCLVAALPACGLSLVLGLTLIGWLLWLPALYCGAFLWIQSEIQR